MELKEEKKGGVAEPEGGRERGKEGGTRGGSEREIS